MLEGKTHSGDTRITLMSDEDLMSCPLRDEFAFDIECYANLFHISFMHRGSRQVVRFTLSDHGNDWNIRKLIWMVRRFRLYSFNGNAYDMLMLAAALCGWGTAELKALSDRIITSGESAWQIKKELQLFEKASAAHTFDFASIDHIDIIEVCPLSASLKIYSARLHGDRLQDLPYDPATVLSAAEAAEVIEYCGNDLAATWLAVDNLGEQLTLRQQMSQEYGVDLRSKSDAQIAEAVIGGEIKKMTGKWPKKPDFTPGGSVRYRMPEFINFETPKLRDVARRLAAATFPLSESGNPQWPEGLGDKVKNAKGETVWALAVKIGGSVYRMGMGGLHSSEKTKGHIAGPDTIIADHDVESYYPRIIINQGLYPRHLGKAFLTVFESIVNRRVQAKRGGDKSTANSLKIVINGTFGKLGSRYSIFFSPDLLAQVTLSGQLSLLMLIERLELAGISVISANTDGIVLKLRKDQLPTRDSVIKQWEADCGYITEETRYVGLYSRDVNNYIALKEGYDKATKSWTGKIDGVKTKGAYSNPWAANDIFRFHKNPDATVCVRAVQEYLCGRVRDVREVILASRDIREFVSVQAVKGGCEYDGAYLGKSVRWYHSKATSLSIRRTESGNLVPTATGVRPVQDLPGSFPDDIDYEWYVAKAEEILMEIGATFPYEPGAIFFADTQNKG